MYSLRGKVAWVTGASRGIGKATAITLAKQGCQMILCAKTKDGLCDTAREVLTASQLEPLCLGYDVSDSQQIKDAFQVIRQAFNEVDILINDAGIVDDAMLGMITNRQIDNTFKTNLDAIIHHMQYASRFMQKQQSGSIVNVSSIMGRFGNKGQTVYAASKAGVIGATLSAAKELATFNVRVNAVAPGFIDTDLTRQLPEHIYKKRLESIALSQKAGTAQEVANVIVFLASDLASHVTGQIVGVDGGMAI